MVNAVGGAAFGVAVQLFSNALRKLPYMRRPWEHVMFGVGGAFAGDAVGQWQVRQRQELDAVMRHRREQEERRQERRRRKQREREEEEQQQQDERNQGQQDATATAAA